MEKFKIEQKQFYNLAYDEIKAGKKLSHWIWFIFPQITGLGNSYYSAYFEIKSLNEARDYLSDVYLRHNLEEILKALLKHEGKRDIKDIMGDALDTKKLLSCMTLFKRVSEIFFHDEENIFSKVINAFFNGIEDKKTINILKEMESNNDYISYDKKTDNYYSQNHALYSNYNSGNFGNNQDINYVYHEPFSTNFINFKNNIYQSSKPKRHSSCQKFVQKNNYNFSGKGCRFWEN